MKLIKSLIIYPALIITVIAACNIASKKSTPFIEKLTPYIENPATYPEKPAIEIYNSEAKYVIYDAYTLARGRHYYTDEIIENVDRSISFIDEDGLITRIPYPYYSIQETKNNANYTKSI